MINDFKRCQRDCWAGIKAYQNIQASLLSFERMIPLANSNDHLVIASLFNHGIVKYAKPFLDNKSNIGSIIYPIKHLKKNPSFSLTIHKHIIDVRNTLVAHDDFEQLEPRILTFGITVEDTDVYIPTSICIANKCISYPVDIESLLKLKEHIKNTLGGIGDKLAADLKKFRTISLQHREQAKEEMKYVKNYGKENIPVGGKHLNPSIDFTNDEWLDLKEPDYTEIHNGFLYEKFVMRHDFHGPEIIDLPNGNKLVIKPH